MDGSTVWVSLVILNLTEDFDAIQSNAFQYLHTFIAGIIHW